MSFRALLLILALAPAGPAEVSLKPIGFEAWEERLQSYRPDIVVVDLWATWCQPCIERFPKMVELHTRYGDRGVRFVSMLLEDLAEPGVVDMAAAFLDRQHATFDNFFMDENLTEAFERLDLTTLPAVLIYDGEGRLRYKLTAEDPNDQFDEEDVEAAIRALL